MPIRGITFDLDGTLADTLPVCYAAFRKVFLKYTGRVYSDGDIHNLFGPCEKGVLQALIEDWEAAYEMFLREYKDAHGLCLTPFAGIADLLESIAEAGVRIAVVTGKGPDGAAISLRQLGLNGNFEIVEAGSPDGAVKKDAIRRILQVWKLEPAEAAHIGDAANDVRAAHASGVIALAAAWSPTARVAELQAEAPDALFRSVPEFRMWLQGKLSWDDGAER